MKLYILLSIASVSSAVSLRRRLSDVSPEEVKQRICRCARKHDICHETCPAVTKFMNDDEDCNYGVLKGICGGLIPTDKTYVEICGETVCPVAPTPEQVKARVCKCAKKHDICGKTCPAIADFMNEDEDCNYGVVKGICGGLIPTDKTYVEVCGATVCPVPTPKPTALNLGQVLSRVCKCAKKHDICGKTCPAIADFMNEDEDCNYGVVKGICGGLIPTDKTYVELCGPTVCPVPTPKPSTPTADQVKERVCKCAEKFGLCNEKCPAIAKLDFMKDEDCKYGTINGLCGGIVPADQTYSEICGSKVCPTGDCGKSGTVRAKKSSVVFVVKRFKGSSCDCEAKCKAAQGLEWMFKKKNNSKSKCHCWNGAMKVDYTKDSFVVGHFDGSNAKLKF